MRVLLINPWGVNNDEFYASGFIFGMNKNVELDFACNFYYGGQNPNGNIYRFFFQRSEKMTNGIKRKILRGLEYVQAWRKIIKLAKRGHYDIIHIHWLLMYKMDFIFLKKLKKYTSKLIYTAHNVIPHVDGEKQVGNLRSIYGLCDVILVHGECIKMEFAKYFPDLVAKVRIQFHGEYFQQSINYIADESDDFIKLKEAVENRNKVFIMFGMQFYNKGTDRLIDIWNQDIDDAELIVVGKKTEEYKELNESVRRIGGKDNICYIDHFVNDNALNFAVSNSDCIVLPYRHASISGVIYTAAAFHKPVLCTKCGSIAEYIRNGVDGLLCETSDKSLRDALLLACNTPKSELKNMGERLSRNIRENYSWDKITRELYLSVYRSNE